MPEDVSFTLTGSRMSGLSYPESDIDCAFVAKDIGTLDLVAERVKDHSVELGLGNDLRIIHTKAGLPWCPIEGFVDAKHGIKTKLDITSRLIDVHTTIQSHVSKMMLIKFPNPRDKEDYINKMRNAHLSGDIIAYNQLKG